MADRSDPDGASRAGAQSATVVIVGGGVAGLAAAHALRGHHPILLEAAERLGGRVCTRRWGKRPYEAGAFSAIPDSVIPNGVTLGEARLDPRPIGILWRGELTIGETPLACLRPHVLPADYRWLQRNAAAQRVPYTVPPRLAPALEAFHHVIHAGPYGEYSPERRADALRRFRWAIRPGGNAAFVGRLARARGVRAVTGARVRSVKREGHRLLVEYAADRRTQRVACDVAVVAVPAPLVHGLVPDISARCARFIERVRHGRWLAVTIAVGAVRAPVSYLAVTDSPIGSIHLRFSARCTRELLATIYFHDASAKVMQSWSDRRVARHALALWRTHGLDRLLGKATNVVDVTHWPFGAPVVSSRMSRFAAPVWAMRGVALAGDYCWSEFPYGVAAAVRSAERAAAAIEGLLRSRAILTADKTLTRP